MLAARAGVGFWVTTSATTSPRSVVAARQAAVIDDRRAFSMTPAHPTAAPQDTFSLHPVESGALAR
jgi:hypothetical protein